MASCSHDGTVRLWGIPAFDEIKCLKDHLDEVYCLSYSVNGAYLASGSKDSFVILWDTLSGNLLQKLKHSSIVYSVCFSPDNTTLASGSHDRKIHIWRNDIKTETNSIDQGDSLKRSKPEINNNILQNIEYKLSHVLPKRDLGVRATGSKIRKSILSKSDEEFFKSKGAIVENNNYSNEEMSFSKYAE